MNVIGLKLISNEAKKLAKAAIILTKKMLKTCLRIQYNAAVFPIYFLYGGLKYVYQQSYTSNNENEVSLEPRNDVIIDAVKKLRNSLVQGMNGISSSKCNTEINSTALDNDLTTDDEIITCPSEVVLPDPIPDVVLEGVCSTTAPQTDKNFKIAFLETVKFTGSDLMWDIPIISAKAKYFADCLKEGNKNEIAAVRKMLDEHCINYPIPKTRREYDKMIYNARNGLEYLMKSSISKSIDGAESSSPCKENSADKKNKTLNVIGKEQKKVEFCFENDASIQNFPKHKVTKCLCDPSLTQHGKMRRETATINRKLSKIHATCSNLLKGLSALSEDLVKVISMKEKLTTLEFQVDEGKRLLQEVESDRFIMKSKLSALEKLINEEEKFFKDVSCESGFYESENNEGTNCEF